MAIFAIADLHLSFNEDKPMNIFGEKWQNHEEKNKTRLDRKSNRKKTQCYCQEIFRGLCI